MKTHLFPDRRINRSKAKKMMMMTSSHSILRSFTSVWTTL